MTACFSCVTEISAQPERVFDLALDVKAHLDSMAGAQESVVGRAPHGQLSKDDHVTWRARHFFLVWTMTVRITEYDRPHLFVDEQTAGPFANFRHEHRFVNREGATMMVDTITFSAPFGPVGRAAEATALAPYLQRLIKDRNKYLKQQAEGSS